MSDPLSIAVLGGVPPVLGGGGLERQARETVAALRRRGHDAFFAAAEPEARGFDLLHCFGAEPDTWQWLSHWRRNPAPLVISPVLVVAPGHERRERLAARIPVRSFGPRMRAELLGRSDLAVAQTAHEAGLLGTLGARKVVEVPNGISAGDRERGTSGVQIDGVPDQPYVLLLGHVSARKRQAESIKALTGIATVVAGGFDGDADERRRFERACADCGARWIGEVTDRDRVLALIGGARALVHLSEAEGQALVVIEALALGTPVVASRLPSNRELAARYPGHIELIDRPEQLPTALAALGDRDRTPAPIPTWDDVAEQLERHYEPLVHAAP